MDWFGVKVAYTELGIWIALIFVGCPSWCARCSR
jgi:ABC-type sulfate transport system permease component